MQVQTVEKKGKNVEEAIRAALDELGCEIEDVSIEVLEEASKRLRKREEKVRIVLDVEDYRKKREQSLEALALRLAEKVKQTQKNVIMRPMSSQERRIVHTVLQEDPLMVTYSMGEEPNRKVVIALKK
ncbi:MAG: Jag N-terminal domain-containing protein [Firmicutes bacterium]|nr:Jag N-terminal domain-containing protein [Bacillota bacterium]